MLTEGSVRMAPVNLPVNLEEEFERDIETLLLEQQLLRQSEASFDRERELNIFRSGSAPPTVEGSRKAIRSLFDGRNNGNVLLGEEDSRSHPAFVPYYYMNNENTNPRMPSSLMLKEDLLAGKKCDFGRIGDRNCRKQLVDGGGSSSSLFSMHPSGSEYDGAGNCLIGGRDTISGSGDIGIRSRSRNFTDALQDDLNLSTTISGHISHSASQIAFENVSSSIVLPAAQQKWPYNEFDATETFYTRLTPPSLIRVQSLGSRLSQPFASSVDPSLPRNRTPGPQFFGRSSSFSLPSIGNRTLEVDTKMLFNDSGSTTSEMPAYGDMESALAGLSLSKNKGSSDRYRTDTENVAFTRSNPNAYFVKPGSLSMLNNQLDAEYVSKPDTQLVSDFQGGLGDSAYVHYLKRVPKIVSSGNINDLSVGMGFHDASRMDLPGYPKTYLEQFLEQQKLQYSGSLSKISGLNNDLYGTAFGIGMPYSLSPQSGSLLSSFDPGNHSRQNDQLPRQNDQLPHFSSMLRNVMGTSKGSWNHDNGILEDEFTSSLLAEFKSNKIRLFELSDIVDHVVEFSVDQYGSRFIQQKLEVTSVEEKNKIFPEILSHSHALMTDVFGNYVIQKFFEHGTESQRNQLANQLLGHVLPLSLQMYGCRVIQKALEVVDVERQTEMVSELDGSIMKCVRDQNGNHVIQKCIECVPQEKINFIISPCYGQVVALSTHPYGCRVIQRILEHCDDTKTQGVMMGEILQSICTLSKDQYGNYVVQHVLQHGKPEERSSIISKLSGQIVKMSQQKFASNVVEKCLTCGSPEERQLLINEMLGSTEENEPLQVMMKDQFANYVVQKVLEICDDRNRELILSRIKAHLNTLKRYTYGKHIVARVEKLITAGERRIGMTSSH